MSIASTMDRAIASSTLTSSTRPTESSNIDSLAETSTPRPTIRSWKVCPPTRNTPITRTPIATMATRSAASAIRASMPVDPSPHSPHRTGVALMAVAVVAGVALMAGPGQRPIARASNGGDVARLVGVVAQLGPQPFDVGIDGPVQHDLLIPAIDGIEQPITADDPTVRLEQHDQQPVAGRREDDGPTSDRGLVSVTIDHQVTQDEWWPHPRTRAVAASFQEPPDAQHQLGRGEGLGQVVIRAGFQAGDAVRGEAAGRQHQDGRPTAGGPRAPDDVQPGHARDHQVEHDQGRRLRGEGRERGVTIGRLGDPVSVTFQVGPDEADDLGIIVHDEDGARIEGGRHAEHGRRPA